MWTECLEWFYRVSSSQNSRFRGNRMMVRLGSWPWPGLCQRWPAGGVLYNDATVARPLLRSIGWWWCSSALQTAVALQPSVPTVGGSSSPETKSQLKINSRFQYGFSQQKNRTGLIPSWSSTTSIWNFHSVFSGEFSCPVLILHARFTF